MLETIHQYIFINIGQFRASFPINHIELANQQPEKPMQGKISNNL